ncbi:hypothetical protein AVEN_228302-1 [Araneus ventricosus]|uniref:Uncharacterized protein n=1 Tax=Araneus ventricosus TaxID=182803 RepID=A0A4Y2IGH1_ARAVE|nr:hypothetical protein AVEN_228302-1 [Araneus ventricosus]
MFDSLENIAALNTALHLLNNPHLREQILESEIEKKGEIDTDKLSKLFLPIKLQEKVMLQMKYVSWEMVSRHLEFCEMHGKISALLGYTCDCFKGILHRNYRWTSCEYLDESKTVQAIVGDGQLDLAFRFTMSCKYDLEDDIIQFWEALPQWLKFSFCQDHLPYRVKYWVKLLMISEDMTDSYCSDKMKENIRRILQNFEIKPSIKLKFRNLVVLLI